MTYIPLAQAVAFCERVKGAKTLRHCPVCYGTSEVDSMSNMGPDVPKCPVCKGLSFVDLAATCCCGMPAILFKDDLIYCGRDLCLNSMKRGRSGGFGC